MEFDAIVVGAGPNGLAAAIVLQREGLSVLLIEGAKTVGGGARTAELTLPGFRHDVCSAIHPTAVTSPFFVTLPLEKHGLEYIHPPVLAAHPFDDGTAAALYRSLDTTATELGRDGAVYRRSFEPLIRQWDALAPDILGPFGWPRQPFGMLRFGWTALSSAERFARRFETQEARGLWAGLTAHSTQPLGKMTTAGIGLVLAAAGHVGGWPLARGGSQSIADALAAYFLSLGGTIRTDTYVESLEQLPKARAVLLDVTPRQALRLAGPAFSALYIRQLRRHRYGAGVFKVDWALDGPVPFSAGTARAAGTVHLGGTFEEVAQSEWEVSRGLHPERPFVLFSQPSRFDSSRAPPGKHTGWGYCHVPSGSVVDRTEAIERQVERFAPGFRDSIVARHTLGPAQLEAYNPNYVGGDIGGGEIDLFQLFNRPALRLSPYRTSAAGVYLCSSSTPPGGGVHGMCGYHAARRAWRDVFQPLKARRLS